LTGSPTNRAQWQAALLVEYFRRRHPIPSAAMRLRPSPAGLISRTPSRRSFAVIVEARIDPVLFGYSYDYVGDMSRRWR
jgi:hypothetical protein